MRYPSLPDAVAAAPASSPPRQENGPVLVAVDGSLASLHALDWAAAEAAARGVSLHAVNVYGWEFTFDPYGIFYGWKAAVEEAVEILEAARAHVATTAPLLQSTGHAVFGLVTNSILRQARGASLIVLGRTSRREPRRWSPSLATKLARRTTVPLAVVGPDTPTGAGPGRGQVMLGLDGPGSHADAVEAAFRAAVRRETGLIVMHAWRPGLTWDLDGGPTSALQEWQVRLPDVAVQQRFQLTDPGCSLTVDASGAALLVLSETSGSVPGRRRRFGPRATTTSWLGDHATGTVLLMPSQPGAAQEVRRTCASLVEDV